MTGTLAVGSDHGEGPVGTPQVNITGGGVGGQYKGTESGRYPDEYGTYRYRYSFAGRDAVIAPGRIGNHVSRPRWSVPWWLGGGDNEPCNRDSREPPDQRTHSDSSCGPFT